MNIAENTACMTEIMRPRWMTNWASFAERRYELRPCQRSSLVRNENCVTEKSAAREACFPSLPTIPTPTNKCKENVRDVLEVELWPSTHQHLQLGSC